jgi:hypothetical protein
MKNQELIDFEKDFDVKFADRKDEGWNVQIVLSSLTHVKDGHLVSTRDAIKDFIRTLLATQAKASQERLIEDVLEEMAVMCGMLQETGDKIFVGGCGKEVKVFGTANERAYGCVDCSAPFHRECLRKHFTCPMADKDSTHQDPTN